jgi:outer membrane protein TolC
MKERVFKYSIVLCLCFFTPKVNGQNDLPSLIHYALEHSRDVRKSNLQVQEAKYIYKEARGHGLPQIDASASYSKMMLPDMGVDTTQLAGMLNSFINDGPDKNNIRTGILKQLNGLNNIDALYTASAGIQITQLIFSQSYWVGLKTAKKTRELYSILKTKTEEEVIADVAEGYYQAGSLLLQLQTMDKSIHNLKEIHRIAELSYKNDLIKESNVNRLKVNISNLEVTRSTIQNGVTIQLNYLKALAGMPADSLLTIDTTSLVNNFTDKSASANFIAENVPSYQVLLKQDEVYNQQIKMANAIYYPTLAAFGKLNYSSYNTSSEITSLSNMTTIGLSLSIPLFTSGINFSKVKQAKIKQAELKEDIFKTKDLLTVNYNNAFLEYQTSHDMLAAQKENKELALKVYNQTAMQYQEGMASLADLLNVNSEFLQADNSYNQQILKCKTSEIKMLQASGNLKSLVSK